MADDKILYVDAAYFKQVRAEAFPLVAIAAALAPIFFVIDVTRSIRVLFRRAR